MPMDDQMRAAFAELVKGRYVLIGGDIIDNDQFNTPLSRFPDAITGQHETMIGLEVHAHMLAQQLDNAWPRPSSSGKYSMEYSGCPVISSVKSPRTSSASKSRSARSEEHTSELQSLMRISYAVFCLKKKKK